MKRRQDEEEEKIGKISNGYSHSVCQTHSKSVKLGYNELSYHELLVICNEQIYVIFQILKGLGILASLTSV